MKITLFGSQHWPGCEVVKEGLSLRNVSYEYVEITDSMKNLKRFLKLRDTRKEYAIAHRVHAVGIPTLMVEDAIYVGPTDEKLDELFK